MTNFSYLLLQKSIYQALIENTELMALIVGVFDHVPQNTDFPYITVGESIINDWSSKTTDGFEQIITIRVWSREGGRKQAASIMEKIYNLLHQVNLMVEGMTLVMLRNISSDIGLESDGWTYQGSMKFRALLESN